MKDPKSALKDRVFHFLIKTSRGPIPALCELLNVDGEEVTFKWIASDEEYVSTRSCIKRFQQDRKKLKGAKWWNDYQQCIRFKNSALVGQQTFTF